MPPAAPSSFTTTSGVCIGACCRTDHEKNVKWVYEWKLPYFRLFSFFPPDFSSRCFGALAGREVRKKCMCLCSRRGVGLTDVADFL